MNYTAVIRTLGKAGEKYQCLLDSLCAQTFKPSKILVYIADGYPIPKETCGKEEYIYVKKGMVAQRALPYDEVDTEYILFLDDDIYLPRDGVKRLLNVLEKYNANIVSPDTFDNASRGLKSELLMTLSGRMYARRRDTMWGYKVIPTCGYSYNKTPEQRAYFSQTNAGCCFLCRKEDFLKIHLEDELWLDQIGYAIGDDQTMFYKMYLYGLKQLTVFGTGIEHLDAGKNIGNKSNERKLIGGDYFFRIVFWHRFIWGPEKVWLKRVWSVFCIGYFYGLGLIISIIKGQFDILHLKWNAVNKAIDFIKSMEYKKIPKLKEI